jgi:hypothetical protein
MVYNKRQVCLQSHKLETVTVQLIKSRSYSEVILILTTKQMLLMSLVKC